MTVAFIPADVPDELSEDSKGFPIARVRMMRESRKPITLAPENSETPLEAVRSWVTPNRLFFVRNHFDVPEIDLASWRLRVEGCVARPYEWTWDELLSLPERSVFATVECAGNGRSFLMPRTEGVQWGAGAIGHAEWTGVPLRTILEKSVLQENALEVVARGADQGRESGQSVPEFFARGLPLEKALDPDTLLATRMNGELLESCHGFPVRLFVPGWYGVASVKWLQSIEVIDHPFRGYYQTKKYTIRTSTTGMGDETLVIGPMPVKSEILRPHEDEVLGVGTNRIFGVAWAGEEAIAGVRVSTDGGRVWNEATLLGPRARFSWCLWEYLWEAGEPGEYELVARAVSESGKIQPTKHDPLRGGYMINFARPRTIQVAAVQEAAAGKFRPAARATPADASALLYDMNAFAEANRRVALDVDVEFTAGAGI